MRLDHATLVAVREILLNEADVEGGPDKGTRPLTDGLGRAAQIVGHLLEAEHPAAATSAPVQENLPVLDILVPGSSVGPAAIFSVTQALWDGTYPMRIQVLRG